ncbi:MAG TPA: hypothetical protein VMT89_10360, partial [Candidatus Acidoferrales bacterium]|nr:hypothetical protein [Candidatus Acidoferrales bacterium]
VAWVEPDEACFAAASMLADDLVVAVLPERVASTLPARSDLFAAVERLAVFDPRQPPQFSGEPAVGSIVGDDELQAAVDRERDAFIGYVSAAASPVALPVFAALAGEAPAFDVDDGLDFERAQKVAGARFGAQFGRTVRRSLQLLILGLVKDEEEALRRAAAVEGLRQNVEDAAVDVRRSVRTLRQIGVVFGPQSCFEVSLVTSCSDGTLLQGFIDVLQVVNEQPLAIEIRSDKPLGTMHRRQAEQLARYGELLRAAGLAANKSLKLGVLLTATGELKWV